METLFRYDERILANEAWDLLLVSAGCGTYHDVWLDFLNHKGNIYIAVIGTGDIEYLFEIAKRFNGCEAEWPDKLLDSILSYRGYVQARGVQHMILLFQPGMYVPIKVKHVVGQLI